METLKKQTHLLILAMFCMVWLSLLSKTVKGDEKFNYDPCSKKGPKYWGELKKEWEICKKGKIQSPIALSKWTADYYYEAFSDLTIDHIPAKAYLNNDGHEIIVDWSTGNAGSIKINNMDYQLQNFHWHHPSEHTLDGKTYPLELHMVHMNIATNDKAVVGVVFEYGRPDPFISLIEKDIKDLDSGDKKYLEKMDPRIAMVDGIRKYFRYIGSLTTPPCTEGVIWSVMEKVQTVSPDQVKILKDAVKEEKNARPLQKVNGREVFYFDPSSRGSVAAE
ncbi:hypothetical protein IC582_009389 [Cucumis melo]